MNTLLARIRPTFCALAAIACIAGLPGVSDAQTDSGTGIAGSTGLQAKYKATRPQLANNTFQRPLVLASNEASDRLSGDIYAVIDHPFAEVGHELQSPVVWCEVLMLHLNTKNCTVGAGTDSLAVAVGRKYDQPLKDAQSIDFGFRVAQADADYLDVRMSAASGPLSTRDYRISLEAVPIDGGKTFIHLGYAYAYGTAARLAMKGYLATVGSDKVGFTSSGKDAQGEPSYVDGVRGVVERNTMRYYLAIDAYLDAPGMQNREKRAALWFDGTERYARQLHEVDRTGYLEMKKKEFTRHKGSSQ
ncbi:MAG: hypothetical protein ACRYGA_16840 [Janthinobacterium lividum]